MTPCFYPLQKTCMPSENFARSSYATQATKTGVGEGKFVFAWKGSFDVTFQEEKRRMPELICQVVHII